jgi:LemA protein
VQGHAGYERGTLEAVVAARNRATAAAGPAAAREAERALGGSVRQLLALAESYPDLKAGESFLSLQRSLVEIEDHIQNARRYYNAVDQHEDRAVPRTRGRPHGIPVPRSSSGSPARARAVPRVDAGSAHGCGAGPAVAARLGAALVTIDGSTRIW